MRVWNVHTSASSNNPHSLLSSNPIQYKCFRIMKKKYIINPERTMSLLFIRWRHTGANPHQTSLRTAQTEFCRSWPQERPELVSAADISAGVYIPKPRKIREVAQNLLLYPDAQQRIPKWHVRRNNIPQVSARLNVGWKSFFFKVAF